MLQVCLILTIPAQSLYARIVGTSVWLQTVPVDPYNLLQGYYVTLRYDVSQVEELKALPGWADVEDAKASGDSSTQPMPIYVVLQAPIEDPQEVSTSPSPWRPVRVQPTHPSNLQDDEVVLKGTYHGQQITYGLEQYFIPEADRDEINDRIRQAQQSGDRQSYLVEVNVTPQGSATPIGLWVEGTFYEF
jgi:uncharacterized membrane-anchored protein